MIYINSIIKLANHFNYQLFSYAGVEDDKKYLMEKYPDQQESISSLSPKYIKWLSLRFGEGSSIQEIHPLPDCIPSLKNYQAKEAGLSQKYNSNPEFKSIIDESFPIDSRGWQNPSDAIKISIDQMEQIIAIAARPPKRKTVEGLEQGDASYPLPEEDRIGKVGEWNLWLPSSKENSCKIAGYNPKTLEPKTTWCTARTSGSNLFYAYTGAAGRKMMLFYIIKDNPQVDRDWLSIAFVNGKIYATGHDGGTTVDRNNEGLTESDLESILGSNYQAILSILQQKSDNLNGISPAYAKIEEAINDVEKFKSLIKGNSEDEVALIVDGILQNHSQVNPAVLEETVKITYDLGRLNKISNAQEDSTPAQKFLAQIALPKLSALNSMIDEAAMDVAKYSSLIKGKSKAAVDSFHSKMLRNQKIIQPVLLKIINKAEREDFQEQLFTALTHPSATREMLESFIKNAKNDDLFVRLASSHKKLIDEDLFLLMITCAKNPEKIKSLANFPYFNKILPILLSDEAEMGLLIDKIPDSEVSIFRDILQQPKITKPILQIIINKTNNPNVLQIIDKHPMCDEEMKPLILDRYNQIINTTQDGSALLSIVSSHDHLVATSENLKTIFNKILNSKIDLSFFTSQQIEMALATHPNTSREVLLSIINKFNAYAIYAISQRPDADRELMQACIEELKKPRFYHEGDVILNRAIQAMTDDMVKSITDKLQTEHNKQANVKLNSLYKRAARFFSLASQ